MKDKLIGKSKLFFNWMPQGVDTLLDLGCAYSFMLNLLGQKSKRRFGLDFDLEKLNQGKLRFPAIKYVAGSGEALPFQDNFFDVVTFFEVLEHVENQKMFIAEVRRVLKPRGIIMFSVPNRGLAEYIDMDNVIFTPLLWCVKKLGFFKKVSDYYLRYHRHYSVKDISKILGVSFVIEKVYYGGFFLNQLAFLVYKAIYLFCLLLHADPKGRFLTWLAWGMDRMTSLDFDHSFGTASDKLCILARGI